MNENEPAPRRPGRFWSMGEKLLANTVIEDFAVEVL
jgi:phosphoribosylformylglycinamidine (FGAM) synthase PurS component